ncbi:MAG: protein kinase domain-containing protein [Phototrophicaceae bacterium]|jgi:serine/threonine protein kinase
MSTTDPLIGKTIGDYHIQSLLGRGGMARVYRGYDKNLDRYAAVKVIDTHLIVGDERQEYYERFQREARAIGRLNHPNIVGVYQFGQIVGAENYYMAMAFIAGEDLRQILKRLIKEGKSLETDALMKIMRGMTSALDYSHEKGVIHRDIKPSNILITPDGSPILTDFGLALNIPEGTIGNTFGSAHYIAPEQAVSSAQAVPQSDLYSLGICLYEILTGRVPFDDASAMSVALKHLSDPPPPPSRVKAGIPPEVEQVVLKMLEKEPKDRYQTGAEVMVALERAYRLPITAAPPSLSVPIFPPTPTTPSDSSQVPSRLMRPTANDPRNKNYERLQTTAAKLEQLQTQEMRTRRSLWIALAFIIIVIAAGFGIFALGSASNNARPTATSDDTQVAALSASATALPTSSVELSATTLQTQIGTGEVNNVTERPDIVRPSATLPATLTPSVTPSNTATLTASSTPASTQPGTSLVGETPTNPNTVNITLRYRPQTLVLYNSSNRTVDVSGLVFITERDGVRVDFYAQSRWSGGSREPNFLPAGDCFQTWTRDFSVLPEEDYCRLRHSWQAVSNSNAFWINDAPDATFRVEERNTVIATCVIDSGECLVPVRAR